MKAFLIARVSTDDQEDALPGQIYKLNDYARAKQFDAQLIQIKESAYSKKRQIFNGVIDEVINYTGKCVVVFDKIDRYTRNSSSAEVMLLNDLCRTGKIELHFISDHLNINERSSAQEFFMLNIGISTAQYYSETISDNVKRRQAQMLRDGIWTGAAPIGYKRILLDGKKWIVPDEVTSTIIRKTFENYASGFTSLKELSKLWFQEYGIKTPHSRIESILKNPFYYGRMRVKGTFYDHNYEPLIDKDLFDKVQSRLHGYQARPHRWAGLPFPYRGLITCAECDCTVTFEIKKKKYVYGHCTQSKYHHNASYINENRLTAQLEAVLSQIHIPDDVLVEMHEMIARKQRNREKTIVQQKVSIESEIKKYQTRLNTMYTDRLDGIIDDQTYKAKQAEFTARQHKLRDDLQKIELLDNKKLEDFSHLLELANKLPNLFIKASPDEKRKIIDAILSNLCLNKDLLVWKYKKPFDLMAQCNKNLSWQGRTESNCNRRFWRPVY